MARVVAELWLATGAIDVEGSSSSAGLYFGRARTDSRGNEGWLASGSRWSSADLLAGGGVNSEWSEAEVGCGAAVCFQRGPIISITDMLDSRHQEEHGRGSQRWLIRLQELPSVDGEANRCGELVQAAVCRLRPMFDSTPGLGWERVARIGSRRVCRVEAIAGLAARENGSGFISGDMISSRSRTDRDVWDSGQHGQRSMRRRDERFRPRRISE